MRIRSLWSVRTLSLILGAATFLAGCSRTLGPVAPPVVPKVTATFTAGIVTFTPTETRTPTSTFTGTPTYSATYTSTDTFTYTPTRTYTPWPTGTFTYTPTKTHTPVYTSTYTYTGTYTYTPTWSHTLTYTFTFAFSPTNTLSPTPTYTLPPGVTLTHTPTATLTYSPTNSATSTWSPTGIPPATDTPTWTRTATSTPTLPAATNTPTTACTGVYSTHYGFDSDLQCWYTANTQLTTTLDWLPNASAPAGAVGGVLHAVVPFGAVTETGGNSAEEFSILLPSTVDLTGKLLQARVYIANAVQGTAWGGGLQVNAGTGPTGSGWCAQWGNISGFGGWYTYTYDLSACAGRAEVLRLGVQIVMAAGCAGGDVYIDSFDIVDVPTPTPTVGGCYDVQMNDLESLTEDGTWSGAGAVRTIVDSGTAPVGAITSGTHAMMVSVTGSGWMNDFLTLENFSVSDWSGAVRVKADVYVPPGTLGSWSQIWFRVDAQGGPYYVAVTPENAGAPAFATGAQTIQWDLNWALGSLTGVEPIYKITWHMNGDMPPGFVFYIDNIRLEECP